MLIKNWKMDFDGHVGLDCTVPCDMYSVLEAHGIIDDPFYGNNEQKLYDLSRKDCDFHTTFALSDDELSKEKIEINFYGLDTICDIYFNGVHLGKTMNMHRLHSFDIKPYAGLKNELKLHISAPLEYFDEMDKLHHIYTDGACAQGASHLRKALYMSGWDWAPRLPNMGIFRDVEILAYDTNMLGDTEIVQHHENGAVTLEIHAVTKHNTPFPVSIICEIDNKTIVLENGHGEIKIENPNLWWPNGYGEQNLYTARFSLIKDKEVIDTKELKIGLRTIVLSRENDEFGQEFCFKVNGVKIFAMGANYVPIDSLPGRMTDERMEKLIQGCLFSNFNCVRVWGGAFYPDDYFYDLCDKYGLIVWQDFMVACANVWMRPEFEAEFIAEAIYNVKRLRHHACIGLFCGNNEMEEAICNWPVADGNDPLVRADYLKLYEDILPKICAELTPYISYTPSSPTSYGGFNDPTNYAVGDVHFWHVWNGNCNFDEYRNHKFRFCSEYGFESLPCYKTIEAFCPEDERNILSYTMENHQKHWHGNVKLINFMSDKYQLPKDLKAAVYGTQLNQANAIKFGVEHFRRCRGYTMGSVYWQLNDSWPVASWSSIDYYGRFKALHYYAKRFYAPVAMGLFNEESTVAINIANEKLVAFCGTVKYGVKKNDFTPVYECEKSFTVEPLTSLDVVCVPNSEFNGTRDAYFYAELYNEKGELIASNVELGTVPKHFMLLKPAIKAEVKATDGGAYITLSSNALAKDVEVSFKNYDIEISDNYFDLPSGKPYTIFAKTELTKEELEKEICLFSVYDMSK